MKFKWQKIGYTAIFFSSIIYADITGNVFIDYNLNGKKDGNDAGVGGVLVKAYCDNGLEANATTDSTGAYSLTVNGNYCRIEANASSAGYYAGQNAQGGHTLVERVANNSIHNISLTSPSSYCQKNPDIAMVAMPGNIDDEGNEQDNSEYGTLFKASMPSDGENADNSDRVILSKAADTGAVWGLTYSKTDKKLYLAASIRRFVFMKDADGDGYGDAGAIYVVDEETNTTKRFITIPNADVGYTPGVKTADRTNSTVSDDDDDDDSSNSKDTKIYQYSGKAGLGDLDISEDEKYLYATNIGAKKLVKIDIKTKTYTQIDIPNPYGSDCPKNNVIPWALKIKGKDVYVGSICNSNVSLGAAIQKYDGANFTLFAKTKSLSYAKQPGYVNDDSTAEPFVNWDDNVTENSSGNNKRFPILSDIEFDNNGDLILGYMDRKSFNGLGGYNAGDIRRMCKKSDGSYEDEGTGDCKTHTYTDQNNIQYKEFYWGDFFGSDNSKHGTDDEATPEISLGSLAMLPGASTVIVSVNNPNDNTQPEGILKLANKKYDNYDFGDKVASKVFVDNSPDDEKHTYFGKSGGFGDVELLCDNALSEIGNYVWDDTNGNGIQDANESGIGKVKVELYKGACKTGKKVGEATTNSDGYYYFGGQNKENMLNNSLIEKDTDYTICIDLNNSALNGKHPTIKDANNNSEDQRDSDGDNENTTPGYSSINFKIENAGSNNHTYDFGFTSAGHCLGDFVWNDSNKNGIQDSNETGIKGITVNLLDENGTKINTVTTNDDGKYKFCNLKEGNYYLEFKNLPAGYKFTQKDAGDDTKDSDADINSGKTDKIKLSDDNMSYDAGIYKFADLVLSGHVYDDGNGDGNVNGTAINNASGSQLYVTLLDANNSVVASKAVDNNGEYSFTNLDNLTPDNNYSIILSTELNATAPKLPADWNYTGEKAANDGNGNDGKADGILNIAIGSDDTANNDFGINEKPKGENITLKGSDAIINKPGDTQYPINLNISDREDNTTTVTIKTLPDSSSGILYYDGEPVKEGQVIKDFDTSKLTVDPADGNQIIKFTYTIIDNAGDESDPYTVEMAFIGEIKLGDFVWLDKNLNGIQDKGEPGAIGVTVRLLNADGSQAIGLDGNPIKAVTDKTGHYVLTHVKAGSDYKIKIDIPNNYHIITANAGPDDLDSDANSNGIITVTNPQKDNYTYDAGIYCECDDYKVHPENHRKLKAPALNVYGALLAMLTLLSISLVRNKEA